MTDMYSMFAICVNLVQLDLGKNFNTNNAKDVFNMFQNCSDILVAKIKNEKINIKYQAFIDK